MSQGLHIPEHQLPKSAAELRSHNSKLRQSRPSRAYLSSSYYYYSSSLSEWVLQPQTNGVVRETDRRGSERRLRFPPVNRYPRRATCRSSSGDAKTCRKRQNVFLWEFVGDLDWKGWDCGGKIGETERLRVFWAPLMTVVKVLRFKSGYWCWDLGYFSSSSEGKVTKNDLQGKK